MERSDKRDYILEVAIRRFAHFGVQKTTLTEIAEDLGMTKQALAYYFSDKQSLSTAVEELIVEEFFGMVERHFAAASSLEQALVGLIDVKKVLFEKYAMLMQKAASEALHNHSKMTESKEKARIRMVQMITALLEQGMAKGELKNIDAAAVATLLFDTISAYEQCAVSKQVVPDPKAFAELWNQQKAVIQLMVNGVKDAAWKN